MIRIITQATVPAPGHLLPSRHRGTGRAWHEGPLSPLGPAAFHCIWIKSLILESIVGNFTSLLWIQAKCLFLLLHLSFCAVLPRGHAGHSQETSRGGEQVCPHGVGILEHCSRHPSSSSVGPRVGASCLQACRPLAPKDWKAPLGVAGPWCLNAVPLANPRNGSCQMRFCVYLRPCPHDSGRSALKLACHWG